MEAEIPTLMIVCFSIVSVIYLAAVGRLVLRRKNGRAAILFALQWAATVAAFVKLYQALTVGVHPMRTEVVSWHIALCGVCWAGSVFLLIGGLYALARPKTGGEETPEL